MRRPFALSLHVALAVLASATQLGNETRETASLYGEDGSAAPLFTFERAARTVGDHTEVEVRFRDADGGLALYERVVYERGSVARYESHQHQVDERYTLNVVDDRALFEVTRDGETRETDEEWSANTVIIDQLPDYIRTHWDLLMMGEEVPIRFVVMFRGDIVGFKIALREVIERDGRPAVVFRLRPGNFFVRWFVDAVDLTFSDDDRRALLEVIGRTPVKRLDGDEWVDFDGRMVWHAPAP